MIHLLVVTLIFMSIVGATGFGFLNMSHSVDMLYSTQSDKVLLSKWVIALENGRIENSLNGRALVPLGINASQDFNGNGVNDVPFHILPDGFGLPKTNSFGRYYVYCPIGDAMDGSSTKSVNTGRTEGDNDSYDVSVIEKNNVLYVANSSLSLPSSIDTSRIAAFILSPYKSSNTTPSCADIKENNGRFYAKDAIVASVGAGFSESEKISKNIQLTTDSDLSAISDMWKLGSEIHYFINVPATSLSVSSDIDFCFDADRYPRKIHLNGNFSNGEISEITGTKNLTIKACNVDLYISDMSFSKLAIDAVNSNITLKDSNIGDLKALDTKVNVAGTLNVSSINKNNVIELSGGELDVKDSSIRIRASGTIENALLLDASSVHLDSSHFTVSKASSAAVSIDAIVRIDESSSFTSNKTGFNLSAPSRNSAFVNQGKLDIIESSINISNNNKGILLKDGGTLGLNANSVFNMTGSSTTAIIDESSLGVYGSSARVSAGICWSGKIFESSLGKSSRTINESMITNRSDWTCN